MASVQKRIPHILTSTTVHAKEINAETATILAISFIRRLGYRGSFKAKRVWLKEGVYTVEIELKGLLALVQVDIKAREIRSYDIRPKNERDTSSFFSPRRIVMITVISAVVDIALYYAFNVIGF